MSSGAQTSAAPVSGTSAITQSIDSEWPSTDDIDSEWTNDDLPPTESEAPRAAISALVAAVAKPEARGATEVPRAPALPADLKPLVAETQLPTGNALTVSRTVVVESIAPTLHSPAPAPSEPSALETKPVVAAPAPAPAPPAKDPQFAATLPSREAPDLESASTPSELEAKPESVSTPATLASHLEPSASAAVSVEPVVRSEEAPALTSAPASAEPPVRSDDAPALTSAPTSLEPVVRSETPAPASAPPRAAAIADDTGSTPAVPMKSRGLLWGSLFIAAAAAGAAFFYSKQQSTSVESAAAQAASPQARTEAEAQNPPGVAHAREALTPARAAELARAAQAAQAEIAARNNPLAQPPAEPAPPRDTAQNPAPEASSSAPAAPEKISVHLKVRPADARVFHRGKEVGKPPLTIELAPGERRAFEVVRDGYTTRKVVIDGTKTELNVGLNPIAE